MNSTYLLLGSNDGDRMQLMRTAITMLERTCGQVTERSSVYQTAAWGITDQPAFLNMVVLLHTAKNPRELLAETKNIESVLGRQRDIKWGQRTLDIDILLFDQDLIELPDLVVPHPYLHLRRFTLVPLAEIAPLTMHPALQKTIAQLLEECPDQLGVTKYS